MINFFNISFRWGKERPLNTRLLIQNVEAPYYDLESVPGIDDSSEWNVQVFRSITSDSARFQLENETSFTTKKGMAKLHSVKSERLRLVMDRDQNLRESSSKVISRFSIFGNH